MVQLVGMKDSWYVLVVKLKYYFYVVVIGESVCCDVFGVFGGYWDNMLFVSLVNGYLFNNYIVVSGLMQKLFGLMFNWVVDGKLQYQDNFVIFVNCVGFQIWWFFNQG